MKRKLTILSIFVFSICLSSCKKENPKPEFVAGEIVFSVYDTVSFKSTYRLFDSLGINLKETYDFCYFTKTNSDSIDTIKLYLNSKSYLTNGGRTYGIRNINDTLFITTNFFNFEQNDANDWFVTIDLLNLKEYLKGNYFKWGILNVPVGQEQLWVDKLKEFDIIESVELNHYIYLND